MDKEQMKQQLNGQVYSSKANLDFRNQSNTMQIPPRQEQHLDLANLKTVKWLRSRHIVQDCEVYFMHHYNRIKSFPILSWVFYLWEVNE